MSKMYSVRLHGDDKPTLVELSEQAIGNLHAGMFVMGKRYNTKTGESTDFGFSPMNVVSILESDYKIEERQPEF